MLQRGELNTMPRLCCAAPGGTVCEPAVAGDSTLERIVDRLSNTIFGYRYMMLRSLYERTCEEDK